MKIRVQELETALEDANTKYRKEIDSLKENLSQSTSAAQAECSKRLATAQLEQDKILIDLKGQLESARLDLGAKDGELELLRDKIDLKDKEITKLQVRLCEVLI